MQKLPIISDEHRCFERQFRSLYFLFRRFLEGLRCNVENTWNCKYYFRHALRARCLDIGTNLCITFLICYSPMICWETDQAGYYPVPKHFIYTLTRILSKVMWVPDTISWHVLGLRMEKTASRYGEELRVYWISSGGQGRSCDAPSLLLGEMLTTPHRKRKISIRNVTQGYGFGRVIWNHIGNEKWIWNVEHEVLGVPKVTFNNTVARESEECNLIVFAERLNSWNVLWKLLGQHKFIYFSMEIGKLFVITEQDFRTYWNDNSS